MSEDDSNKESKGESSKEEDKKLTEDEIFELKMKECLEEINKNPKYNEEFEKYSHYSIDSFKNSFAVVKANISIYGKYYLKREEEFATRFRVKAEERFWDIQQKKLFDLQCRWRAEEIKIPEVAVSAEFEYWGEHISLCPFLSPVTQKELDLYMEFISSVPYNDKIEWAERCQDYENLKISLSKGPDEEWRSTDYSLWYRYHDSMTQQNLILTLPDIRGEKENFYIEMMREKRRKEWQEKEKNMQATERDDRPRISYSNNDFGKFIEKFEDANLLKLHKARDHWEEFDEDYDLNNAKETLQTAGETIEMDYNESWRRGIIDAASRYSRKRILQELPKVFNDYLFRLSINLPLADTHDKDYEIAKFKVRNWKEDILAAREIMGEPKDFNF